MLHKLPHFKGSLCGAAFTTRSKNISKSESFSFMSARGPTRFENGRTKISEQEH